MGHVLTNRGSPSCGYHRGRLPRGRGFSLGHLLSHHSKLGSQRLPLGLTLQTIGQGKASHGVLGIGHDALISPGKSGAW